MKDIFAKEHLFWIVAGVILVAILGIGGFVAYQQFTKATTPASTETTTKTEENKYPKETLIEGTSKPNVKIITPSRNDTTQVKSESGEMIEAAPYVRPVKK